MISGRSFSSPCWHPSGGDVSDIICVRLHCPRLPRVSLRVCLYMCTDAQSTTKNGKSTRKHSHLTNTMHTMLACRRMTHGFDKAHAQSKKVSDAECAKDAAGYMTRWKSKQRPQQTVIITPDKSFPNLLPSQIPPPNTHSQALASLPRYVFTVLFNKRVHIQHSYICDCSPQCN